MNAGDEHWTKVLQANDVLGRLAVCPYHGKKLPLHCAFNDDVKTASVGADQVAERGEHASCAGAPADHPPGDDVHCSTETKERTVLSTLYDRFCQWLSETRRSSPLLRLPLAKSRCRRSSSLRRSPEDDAGDAGPSSSSNRRGRRLSYRLSNRRCNSTSPSSSSLADLNDPAVPRAASGTGSWATTSTSSSTTTATTTSTGGSDVAVGTGSTGDVITWTASAGFRGRDDVDACLPLSCRRVTSARSGNDVSTACCVVDSSANDREAHKEEYSPLILTWPTTNGKLGPTYTVYTDNPTTNSQLSVARAGDILFAKYRFTPQSPKF